MAFLPRSNIEEVMRDVWDIRRVCVVGHRAPAALIEIEADAVYAISVSGWFDSISKHLGGLYAVCV